MNTHIIASVIEILLTAFFIGGVWNENKIAVLEQKLFQKIKKFGGKK